MEALGLLVPVGFIVLVILLAVRARRREQARQALLRQWASVNGWSYEPSPAVDWIARLPGRGRQGVSLLLSGTLSGRPVTVADYSYSTRRYPWEDSRGSKPASDPHQFIVVIVTLRRSLPDLAVQRRIGLSRLARTRFGGDTRSTDVFDQQFRVLGDAAVASQVIPPTLLADHVDGAVPPWSTHDAQLMTYYRGRLQDPERIPELVGPVLRVADHLDPQQ